MFFSKKKPVDKRRWSLATSPLTDEIEVSARIGAKDGMFKKDLVDHYFSVGRSALEAIRLAMLATGKTTFTNILDLPSGHGRVLRVLKAAFPQAKLTACDLNRAGVDFCVKEFGAAGNYSDPDPDKISLAGGYDLIWSGSLLTHLDANGCRAFLQLFTRLLSNGGIFVVTTHGRHVVNRLRAGSHTYKLDPASLPRIVASYDATGFGYADYPKQGGYGVSASSPEWLMREVAKLPNMQIVNFSERFWDRHQDVLACIKTA